MLWIAITAAGIFIELCVLLSLKSGCWHICLLFFDKFSHGHGYALPNQVIALIQVEFYFAVHFHVSVDDCHYRIAC